MDMGLGRLRQLVMDREARGAAVHGGHKESDMTERLNWTEISAEWVKGQGTHRYEFLSLIAMLSGFTYVGKEQGNKIAPTSLDCCEAYKY